MAFYFCISCFALIGLTSVFCLVDHFAHPDRETIRKRMAEGFRKQASAAVAALYKNPESISFDLTEHEYGISGDSDLRIARAPRLSVWQRFDQLLQEVNVPATPGRFLLFCIFFGLLPAIVGFLLAGWQVALALWAAGSAMPIIGIRMKRNARRERFLQQLPNAFDLMARVLRAGQSLPQAIQAVADSFDDPLASEFAHCQQQEQFGLRPDVVFREMAQRSGVLENRIFVMAMIIQRQIGGNLSEMLERLAIMIRARLSLRQHIRTLTAEGRMQGLTLVFLPIVMFFILFFVNRQYVQVLLDHRWLLAGTAASMAVGMLWIRAIINFED